MKQKNFFIEEISQNELKNKKHKNDYRDLNYIGHLLILISTVTRCVSIPAFFFFFFFNWYSYRNCEFCNVIKILCYNCKN